GPATRPAPSACAARRTVHAQEPSSGRRPHAKYYGAVRRATRERRRQGLEKEGPPWGLWAKWLGGWPPPWQERSWLPAHRAPPTKQGRARRASTPAATWSPFFRRWGRTPRWATTLTCSGASWGRGTPTTRSSPRTAAFAT